MKITSADARRIMHEGNPAPNDAIPEVVQYQDDQATLAAILASPRQAAAPARRPAFRAWKVAVPATAVTAALAGTLAVMLSTSSDPQPGVVSQPSDSGFASLVADLTAHPSAHHGDAAAVLRQLADAAAIQPAVPLGPVEYSQLKSWGLDLGPLHYNLNYVSHETSSSYAWKAPDGSYLGYYTVPGGKYEPGTIPLQQNGPNKVGAARFAWYDPAKLPSDIPALRAHLIKGPDTRGDIQGGGTVCSVSASGSSVSASGSSVSESGSSVSESGSSGRSSTGVPKPTVSCGPAPVPPLKDDITANAIAYNAEDLMEYEPLSPAVRASLLRVLADAAAQNLPNAHFIDMGTVKDRAGHVGHAIGFQDPDSSGAPGTQTHLEVMVFDPSTGALLGDVDAYCKNLASTYPAAGSCAPEGYDQIIAVKAVQNIPPAPKLPPVPQWQPQTSPPQTGASRNSGLASPTP